MWAKMDDSTFRKTLIDVGKDAKLLHLAGTAECAANLTDGYLSAGSLRAAAAMVDVTPSTAEELAAAGLWERREGGAYYILTYLKENLSRADYLRLCAVNQQNGKKGGRPRKNPDNNPMGKPLGKRTANPSVNPEANPEESETKAVPVSVSVPVAVPVPVPVPSVRAGSDSAHEPVTVPEWISEQAKFEAFREYAPDASDFAWCKVNAPIVTPEQWAGERENYQQWCDINRKKLTKDYDSPHSFWRRWQRGVMERVSKQQTGGTHGGRYADRRLQVGEVGATRGQPEDSRERIRGSRRVANQ